MQKLSTVNGDMFWCGWPPPALDSEADDMASFGLLAYGLKPVLFAQLLFIGVTLFGPLVLAIA